MHSTEKRVDDALVHKLRTICEVHREIYDLLTLHHADSPAYEPIVEKLHEAFFMAKRMNAKLRQYKYNYDSDWWEKESAEIRAQKAALRSRRNFNI